MKHYIGPSNPMRAQFDARASYQARLEQLPPSP